MSAQIAHSAPNSAFATPVSVALRALSLDGVARGLTDKSVSQVRFDLSLKTDLTEWRSPAQDPLSVDRYALTEVDCAPVYTGDLNSRGVSFRRGESIGSRFLREPKPGSWAQGVLNAQDDHGIAAATRDLFEDRSRAFAAGAQVRSLVELARLADCRVGLFVTGLVYMGAFTEGEDAAPGTRITPVTFSYRPVWTPDVVRRSTAEILAGSVPEEEVLYLHEGVLTPGEMATLAVLACGIRPVDPPAGQEFPNYTADPVFDDVEGGEDLDPDATIMAADESEELENDPDWDPGFELAEREFDGPDDPDVPIQRGPVYILPTDPIAPARNARDLTPRCARHGVDGLARTVVT